MKFLTEAEREIWELCQDCGGGMPEAEQLLSTINELRETIANESNAWFQISSMIIERDKLREALNKSREALKYYGAMKFNRETQQWMPGGPDKATNALATIEEILKETE